MASTEGGSGEKWRTLGLKSGHELGMIKQSTTRPGRHFFNMTVTPSSRKLSSGPAVELLPFLSEPQFLHKIASNHAMGWAVRVRGHVAAAAAGWPPPRHFRWAAASSSQPPLSRRHRRRRLDVVPLRLLPRPLWGSSIPRLAAAS